MTFLGKILVVVQVILSVCFMAFAGAVYTTQTNWKKKTDDALTQVSGIQKQLTDNQAELNQFKADATTKINEATNQAGRFEAQANGLQQQVARLTTELDTVKTEAATFSAQSLLSAQEAKDRQTEAISQRIVNKDLHDSTNKLIAELRLTEDKLFNITVEQQQTQNKQDKLLANLAAARSILRIAGLDIDAKTAANSDAPPPLVIGLVLDTKKSDRSGNVLVEISVGSDDGLLKGHSLFVYRVGNKKGGRGKFLGKIEIVHVTPDRAVGTVVQRAKNGIIEKGDNVSTKL